MPSEPRTRAKYPMVQCLNGSHPPFNIEDDPNGCPIHLANAAARAAAPAWETDLHDHRLFGDRPGTHCTMPHVPGQPEHWHTVVYVPPAPVPAAGLLEAARDAVRTLSDFYYEDALTAGRARHAIDAISRLLDSDTLDEERLAVAMRHVIHRRPTAEGRHQGIYPGVDTEAVAAEYARLRETHDGE